MIEVSLLLVVLRGHASTIHERGGLARGLGEGRSGGLIQQHLLLKLRHHLKGEIAHLLSNRRGTQESYLFLVVVRSIDLLLLNFLIVDVALTCNSSRQECCIEVVVI